MQTMGTFDFTTKPLALVMTTANFVYSIYFFLITIQLSAPSSAVRYGTE
jgi:hypothetical protein